MDAEQFRKAAYAAIDEIISYFDSLSTRRVTPTIKPGYLAPLLPTHAPSEPEPWESITPDIASKIIPGLTHWQSPNFMAFFPATVTFPSILGELYSAAFTAPAFNWLCSPACTELETRMLDWVAQLLDLPSHFLSSSPGGGVLQGSASEAVVVVMLAAREKAVRAHLEAAGITQIPDETPAQTRNRENAAADVRSKLVAIASEQTHSSTAKAAIILGVRFRAAGANAASGWRMTGQALDATARGVLDEGLIPFFVTATMGTTGTCACDPLDEIGAVKNSYPHMWVHVDAAYAGAALVCEEYRPFVNGVELVDSFNFNMHKWLLVNFDASCLWVTNREDLIRALSITPSYLVNPADIAGLVTDYRDWQIPLGRRFRALKIWFVLRSYGVKSMQAMIRKHIALGETFAALIAGRPDLFKIMAGPQFALTVLRCVGRDGKEAATTMSNELTKKVYELINSRGEIFLTSTVLEGVYAIRVVSANERANETNVKKAFQILVLATEEVQRTSTL